MAAVNKHSFLYYRMNKMPLIKSHPVQMECLAISLLNIGLAKGVPWIVLHTISPMQMITIANEP
jgi:hypothetical protein